MKTNTLVSLLGLSSSAAAAAVSTRTSKPFGYASGSKESIANLKDKIENVVWILLENRSFDNILGGVERNGLDNVINNGPFCNLQDVTNPSSAKWCSVYKDFDSVRHDPDHSVTGYNMEQYGTYNPNNADIASGSLKPSMQGFVEQQMAHHKGIDPKLATEEVMGYYSEDEIPTLVDLVDEFTTFNYWHSCVPGPTNPNRLCSVAGTADGHGSNDKSFDVSGVDIPSIFQAATEKGISWQNYDGTNGAFLSDALFFNWTAQHAKKNVVPLENFYQDAYLGLLPQLSYINPSCCDLNTNSMHPSGNVSFGQVLVKQIYDAVRTGPQWDKTLLLVTFDETGGFFDHVEPPLAVRPDNKTYTETALDGSKYTFSYDRLGGRMPTWLISPYSPKGHIENYGVDPATGESAPYSSTSVLKTLGYLWDLKDLTPRVSHSPAFDHLIGPHKRHAPAALANPRPFPDAV
ncbi:putative phosphatidylglycerol specific phospholipase C [Aspergillus clavatus NRRL 1]|uniref:Phosphatidylglycerol specific phospholipase C, putative n=2 Tax=Aspergillus clavatus TaxID=5057 RepID=E9R9Q5_ASPCL|nr:phosphatidylglycerol specific phospholipase C, putative [Aspergillus clavatus NRRL 1]ABG20596.1 PLC-C [Aspergillus clavatus]EAW11902.1 phosphatidylglycerol specific phospholipase C, putative [Aspergillus clavatus NRRL 1]